MARRGASGLSGILLVDKPAGLTSHDVVSAVRRVAGERRVGHAGTLDPMATGLLVILVGPATRLAPYLQAAEKSYLARIVFGTQTDTDDADGEPLRHADVPSELADRTVANERVAALVGHHEQVPPTYSAIKRGGRTAHKAARAGSPIQVEPRAVDVRAARLVDIETGPPVAWQVELDVSKGTYIRALARDLGHDLSTAAHLGALRRLRSGDLGLADASTLDQLASLDTPVADLFVDPVRALGLPVLEIDDSALAGVTNGCPLPATGVQAVGGDAIAVVHARRLLGIYRMSGGTLRAEAILPGGIAVSAS